MLIQGRFHSGKVMGPAALWVGIGLMLVLVLYRSISGFFSPLPLQVDEAQYLGWSHDLALGYYSKPPMIAWMLAVNRAACDLVGLGGLESIEGCARMSQALALGLAAFFGAAVSWALFANRIAALVTALILAISPLFGFYSLFATTDAWLLMWWSVGLWAFVRGLEDRDAGIRFWVVCGIAVGLGLLSKYSMGLFVISGLIVIWSRRRLFTLGPWIAAGVGLAVFLPNLIWNARNQFPTFSHHVDISQIEGLAESAWTLTGALTSFAEFLGAQLLILGPFALLSLLIFLPRHLLSHPSPISQKMNLLLLFAAPMLAVIIVQALLSRAHANWAAPAYLSIAVIVGMLWTARDRFDLNARWGSWLLGLTVALGLAVSLTLIHGLKYVYGHEEAFKIRAVEKLRGWREVALWAAETSRGENAAIVTDDRRLLANIKGYSGVTAYALDLAGRRNHHYAWFYRFSDRDPASNQRFLLLWVGTQVPESMGKALAEMGFAQMTVLDAPILNDFEVKHPGDKISAFWVSR